jgi:hypothetical protein
MVTIKELHEATGGLSNTSKMPGFSFGIPAEHCKMGSILRKIKGSACFDCYTFKGFYVMYPNVAKAQAKRYRILMEDMDQWADNMAELIRRKLEKKPKTEWYFRWHDAGDIQSVEHLVAIADIAVTLPWVQFWLPTQERKMVKQFLAEYECPENLLIRISTAMVGGKPKDGVLASTIDSEGGFDCKAPSQNSECRDCRACWNPKIKVINYKKH